MTLIIRSPGKIARPLPGSFDGPNLGVNGVASRFVSIGAASSVGCIVASLKDLVGGHNLAANGGVATYEEVSGIPVVSLAAAGNNSLASDQFSNLPKGRTIALLAYFSANPAALEQIVTTIPTTKAVIAVNPNGQFSTYGDTGPWLTSALPAGGISRPGWFKIIASYGADGSSKLSVNGVTISGTSGYGGSGSPSQITIKGSGSIGMKFADLVIIDHAVTDMEIARISEGLGEWLL